MLITLLLVESARAADPLDFGACDQVFGPLKTGLTEKELSALKSISNMDDYGRINSKLRSRWRRWFPDKVIPHIDSALEKLPRFNGIVFRGVKLNSAIYKSYHVGKIISNSAYTASSVSKTIAGDFTTRLSDLDHITNVMFVIESRNGRDISKYSGFSEKEGEVLFPRSNRFKIIKMEFDIYHYVYLEDLGVD